MSGWPVRASTASMWARAVSRAGPRSKSAFGYSTTSRSWLRKIGAPLGYVADEGALTQSVEDPRWQRRPPRRLGGRDLDAVPTESLGHQPGRDGTPLRGGRRRDARGPADRARPDAD